MRVYRLSLSNESGQNIGFSWARSKVDADKAAATFRRENRGCSAEVALLEFDTSKAGIIGLLEATASHPVLDETCAEDPAPAAQQEASQPAPEASPQTPVETPPPSTDQAAPGTYTG